MLVSWLLGCPMPAEEVESDLPGHSAAPFVATRTWDTPPDLEVVCADEWPRATCLEGCASAEDRRWAEGYLQAVATSKGLPREVVDAHLRVRDVKSWGVPDRYADLQLQLESDWVIAVWEEHSDALPGPPLSAEEAAAAFGHPAVPDLRRPPRPWSEVGAAIDACQAQNEVTFAPEAFCSPRVEGDVRIVLAAPFWPGQYAYLDLYAWSDATYRCDTNFYEVPLPPRP